MTVFLSYCTTTQSTTYSQKSLSVFILTKTIDFGITPILCSFQIGTAPSHVLLLNQHAAG